MAIPQIYQFAFLRSIFAYHRD